MGFLSLCLGFVGDGLVKSCTSTPDCFIGEEETTSTGRPSTRSRVSTRSVHLAALAPASGFPMTWLSAWIHLSFSSRLSA